MSKSKGLYIYLGTLLLATGFLFGVLFGWSQSGEAYIPTTDANYLPVQEQEKIAKDLDFEMFWQVWNIVKTKYVDNEDITDQDLFYGALEGIVGALDDPYSIFLDPDFYKTFDEDLSGSFQGIGAEIGIRDGVLTIVAPLANSPAEKAGLKSGDRVFKVDGEEAFDWSTDHAIQVIRGEKGTPVVLTVARDGADDFIDITIIRDIIEMPSVELEYKEIADKKIAYLALYSFNQDTYKQFVEKMMELTKDTEVDGLILDLRDDPGGYLDIAIEISSEWVEKDGIVVSEKMGDGSGLDYYSYAYAGLENMPTVILINEGSASASEIVAGALQDHNKAVLVGQTSFGKGSIQNLHELADGSSVKITIGKWYTPEGQNIDKEGIDPDIYVEYAFEDWEAEIDPQLNKALEVFTWDEVTLEAEIAKSQEENKSEKEKWEELAE